MSGWTAPTGTRSRSRLQEILGLTPGNLITHLRRLEGAGYVASRTTCSGRSSRTAVRLTGGGRAALDDYTVTLRGLLDGL